MKIVRQNMSQNKGDDAEYMADEYEREDVDNEFHGRERGGSESDVDEYDHLVCIPCEITYMHILSEINIVMLA